MKAKSYFLIIPLVTACKFSAQTTLKDQDGVASSALDKCIVCHSNETNSVMSNATKNAGDLQLLIPFLNEQTSTQMTALAKFSETETASYNRMYQSAKSTVLATYGGSGSSTTVSSATSCTDDNKQKEYLAALPRVEGSLLAQILERAKQQGSIVFYDDEELPRNWQQASDTGRTASLRTAANPVNEGMYENEARTIDNKPTKAYYFSDGAREFPWNHTGGVDLSFTEKNGKPVVKSRKFLIPAPKGIGELGVRDRTSSPFYFGKTSNINGPQVAWNFYPSVVFAEQLMIQHPENGKSYTFELRLRTKIKDGLWKMDVFRPFSSPADLAAAIKKACASSKEKEKDCSGSEDLVAKLAKPETRIESISDYINAERFGLKRDPLTLSSTAQLALSKKAAVHKLPKMNADLVARLLSTTPMQSVFNRPWIDGEQGKAGWAPSTEEGFSIVPKDYFSAFLPMNQSGCMGCHSTAGRHVDNFDSDPKIMFAPAVLNDRPDGSTEEGAITDSAGKLLTTRVRTWYNFIPGGDTVFSFHPFGKAAYQKETEGASNYVPLIESDGRTLKTGVLRTCLVGDHRLNISPQTIGGAAWIGENKHNTTSSTFGSGN